MKTKYKLLIAFLICNIIVQILCAAIFRSLIPGIVLLALEAAALVTCFAVNRLVLTSNWFKELHADPEHEIYPDNAWYRKHDERNFDLVNLGSNSAKYAFDYTNEPVKAMNWSSGTQTLIDDYKLIRNFHSILKENGTVIITIMPFTSINKKTGLIDAFKFYKVLDSTQIAPEYRKKCGILERLPICFGKPAVKAAIKKLLGRDREMPDLSVADKNLMNDKDLENHAAMMIESWKKEFSIDDLEQPLTEQNREGRSVRVEVMGKLLDFLKERGYRVVFVIPPVSGYLKKYFTDQFMKIYIYSYLRQVCRDIPILNYMANSDFFDKDLYFNSYYLNKRGAGMFTHRVISDLKEMKML